MKDLMNLLMDGNFYMVISVGTFACYLFLSSCFISIPRNERVVHYLRVILAALLCWTAGSVLMRVQISPGEAFWYQFSMLGLFIIPIAIYGFLFCVLEITDKSRFLNSCMVVTLAAFFLNAFTGCLLPVPEMQLQPDGDISYIYHATGGMWLWIAAELLLLVYVTVLAHKKIGTHYEYRRKLGPLLLGILLLFAGNICCLLPWGRNLPLDAIGGLCMAVCLVYVVYKQYFFSFSLRIITGVVYFIATVIAFIPIVFFEWNMDRVISAQMTSMDEQSITVFIVAECAWCIFILAFARKRVEYALSKKKKYIVDHLRKFQDEVTSVVSKKSLYQMIRDTLSAAVVGSDVHIVEEKEGRFTECTEKGDQPLTEEEEARIRELFGSGKIYKDPAFAVFKYDNQTYGFLYVELQRKNRFIYDEVDCIRQIGNSVSGVLKSIHAYETVYQVSIHDGLTGLYNWNYCQECLKKLDIRIHTTGMIYLDIDNFKLYNDLYGESTGDEVLHWVAKQMQNLADEDMQVFRVGANEFLIIMRENRKDNLISFAEQIQNVMLTATEDKPNVIQLITFSIGIACDTSLAQNATELFRQARRASFYAKENGKNCIEVYEKKDLEEKKQDNEKGYNQVSPTIFALMAAIDAKDSFTFEHSENVSKYAERLAMKLGLPKEDVQTARVAGLLHDIGKIGIQDDILKKKGKLTKEEYEIIKTHVEKSVEMIHFLPHMNYVIPAVLSHHERYDGKGYPNGIKGKEIPILGRILAVCDSFDAMVSRRAYKERLSVEYAIGELERGKGTQFDPDVAQAFIEMVKEDPSFINQ